VCDRMHLMTAAMLAAATAAIEKDEP
jgi:hypothetical protein